MKRRVALLVETSSEYGRGILTGVIRYMRMHNQWLVYAEQSDLLSRPPQWLETWNGDGIISRATTPELRDAAERLDIALVDLTDRHESEHAVMIRSDDAAIGSMAADHLLKRHFSRFAFCGYEGEAWSTRRQTAFVEAVADRSEHPVAIYNSAWHGEKARTHEEEQQSLMAWLSGIERPFAVMTGNDGRGRQVIDACVRLGLAVPHEVAVIGVDNDEILCRICSPPLSSVIPAANLIGFRSAEVLDDMMSDRIIEPKRQFIAPLGVSSRQSTDVVAIDDRSIGSAMQYIRENACQQISVDDVAQSSSVSRSTLERQFRKILGRTPQEEIRYVQIQKVKELLTTTDLSVARIADLCGFEHPEYLHAVFKRFTSVTPGRFRKERRQ